MHTKEIRCVAQRTSLTGDCAKITELADGLREQLRSYRDYQEMSDIANMISDLAYDMKNAIASLAADESQRPGLECFKKMFNPDPIYVQPQEGLPKPNYPLESTGALTIKRADGSVDEDQPPKAKELEEIMGCTYEVIENPIDFIPDFIAPPKKVTKENLEQFQGVYGC